MTSVSAQSAIRTAIVSNSNTGIAAAAALSSRVAARRSAHRKGKGKFAAKAAAKVDEIVFSYIDYLQEIAVRPEDLDPATTGEMFLARVTRVLGGKYMEVLTQMGDTASVRIPGHLTAKGKVSHKRHMTHVFGVGDVVIVEHGDVKGKFDSPALLALLESRFSVIGYRVPAGFFSSAKDSVAVAEELAAEEDGFFEFDRSEEAARLLKKRTLRAKGGAGAADEEDDEEAPVDIDAI